MSASPSDTVKPDFFGYTDAALTGSISQTVRQNDKNTLRRLLKKRKKTPVPLSTDNRKWTALHIAASEPKYKECLELLLKYGDSILLDIDDQTFEGKTALHIACENGCEESVLTLLQTGCDPNKRTLEGNVALHIAAAKGYSKIAEYLLNYSRNANVQDWQGFTPLHLAAMDDRLEVSHILLEKGADVQSKDFNGNLPLHLACQNGNLNITRLLLERDLTPINYQNPDGMTPIMLAVRSSHLSVVRYLLENRAMTDIRDKRGRIAMHFAAYGGKVEILRHILHSTNIDCIEPCLFNIANVLQEKGTFYSLTCCAIHSGSVECLDVLINSKLPKRILQIPTVEHDDFAVVYSPLAYVFSWFTGSRDEELNSCLRLLLEHNITMLDEFCKVLILKWSNYWVKFVCPFSRIFNDLWPLSKQLHYFNLLNANNVTIDYCLLCYHNNTKPFATFTNYEPYYKPVIKAVLKNNIEVVKLLLANSAILEPDELRVQCLNKLLLFGSMSTVLKKMEEARSIYQYLFNLKPVYSKNVQQFSPVYFLRYPYSTVGEEFSKSTLQQFCRTAIRKHLREPTLEDNLRNFRRKILELPLANSLKDYLLFKS